MSYEEALKVFSYETFNSVDELRKEYLKLSKENHPDVGGNPDAMKRVNAAYEVLKKKIVNKPNSSIYIDIKNKLDFYISKKSYPSDSLECKYSDLIKLTINKYFSFCDQDSLLKTGFNAVLKKIHELFEEYKKESLQNIPDFFLSMFGFIDNNTSFDNYVDKINIIVTSYEKLNNRLDDVIRTSGIDDTSSLYKDALNMKSNVIKDIVSRNITLEDGIYKLQAEVKAMVLKYNEFNEQIEETYNLLLSNFNKRMSELKPVDMDEINIAMDNFNEAMALLNSVQNKKMDESILSSLKKMNFIKEKELQEDTKEYELYITYNLFDDEKPEIVLKKSDDGVFVNYIGGESVAVEKFMSSKNGFYQRYCKLENILSKATFWGIKCVVKGSSDFATLLYYAGGLCIVLNEDNHIFVTRSSNVFARKNYTKIESVEIYKDKKVLYDKIYNDFLNKQNDFTRQSL